MICHIDSDGTYRYYHSNELGSTIALTDASGSVTDQFAYMPYGYAKHQPGPNSSFSTHHSAFLWLGGYGVYYDADTQLHLTLYRAYSCHLKRFMQADPLGIDGGSNVYMMANLNPLFFIDPYGLCAEDPWYKKWMIFGDVSGNVGFGAWHGLWGGAGITGVLDFFPDNDWRNAVGLYGHLDGGYYELGGGASGGWQVGALLNVQSLEDVKGLGAVAQFDIDWFGGLSVSVATSLDFKIWSIGAGAGGGIEGSLKFGGTTYSSPGNPLNIF